MAIFAEKLAVDEKLPYKLAAAFFKLDGGFLAISYPLLIAPSIVEIFTNQFDPALAVSLSLAERILQLLFLFFVSFKWARMLKMKSFPFKASSLAKVFTIGMFLWALLVLPPAIFIGVSQSKAHALSFALLVLLVVPGLIIGYRYFMYSFPISFTNASLIEASVTARTYVMVDRLLPLRCLAAPTGITLTLTALSSALYPDGRSLSLSLIGACFSGLLWVLSCYLGLGFGIALLGEKSWRELEFDPYREARTSTLTLQAPHFLGKMLSFKSGIRFLLVSLLIWFGNISRLELMKPAPEITLISTSVKDDIATIVLQIKDEDYKFRGFQPIHFSLAGERFLESPGQLAGVISQSPSEATLGTHMKIEGDPRFQLPYSDKPLELTLEFQCTRSGDALTALQDLWLWYRHVKIMQVKLS